MKCLQLVACVLISIAVTVTSGKQIEVPSSKLMLEYNWPEPKKNLGRFPHAKSCSQFYVIKPDDSQSVKECPENELFDFRTLRCRPKVVAKCWKDMLKKDHSKKIKRHFRCPFPWGLYPDVEDCSTFYHCLSGRPYLRKCPSSTLFDKAERTCISENEALCADDSDIVEEDYKCPYKWGYFTYSKDCSKFYECLRKVPSLRSCKKNMLFDNIKRKCMPMSDVDCRERFNPYEKDKPSTEHVSTGEKGITTENIPPEKTLETTKVTSIGEGGTTGRVSNTGGESTNISSEITRGGTTKRNKVTKDVTSECRKVFTEKFLSSRGLQGITKLTATAKGVTTGRFSNGEDGMTINITSKGGEQKIMELTSTSEGVTTNSNVEMITRHIPTRETQETTKLSHTGEGVVRLISVEEERDKFKHISTERIQTSREGFTPEIMPVEKEQKAADERL